MAWNWADVTGGGSQPKVWNWADVTSPKGTAPYTGAGYFPPSAGVASTVPDFQRPFGGQAIPPKGGINVPDYQRPFGGQAIPPVTQSGTPIPTFAEFLSMFGGGGGGVDLSGFNAMLGDVASRETALGERKAEQEAFIQGIIDAATSDVEGRMAGVEGAYEGRLTADAARRATEMGTVREGEAARLARANAAREALGAAPSEADLTSLEAQSEVAGIGAAGSAADRDLRIKQSILEQQYAGEKAGLTPMQLMANMQLSNAYEDRLAQLASERAAIQGQMAAAKSAARGPSLGEQLGAFEAYQGLYGPGEAPDLGDTGASVLDRYITFNPSNAGLYSNVMQNISTLLSSYGVNSSTNKLKSPIETANDIVGANPQYAPAYDFIVELVQSYVG
jgi:hypothetical protein